MRKLNSVQVAIAILIVLLSQFAIFQFGLFPVVNATNWLTGYSNRVQMNVSQSSGAGTNYDLNFTISNSTGTNSGYVVYANGHVKNLDFSDVNVTLSDGSTPLSMYNETVNSGVNATFWFKDTDDLSTTLSTLYVYYGKTGSTSTYSLSGTFPKFADDFEWNNMSRWNSTISSYATESSTIKQGVYAGANTATGGSAIEIVSTAFGYGISTECWMRATAATSDTRMYVKPVGADSNQPAVSFGANSGQFSYVNAGGTFTNICAFSINTWYRVKIFCNSISSTDFYLFSESGALVGSAVGVQAWQFAAGGNRVIIYGGITSGTGYHDFFIVRPHVTTEPSFTWGTEETSTSITAYSPSASNQYPLGGQSVIFSMNWTSVGANIDTLTFSWNDSGSWTNVTTYKPGSVLSYIWNTTQTVNATGDITLGWMEYANNTVGTSGSSAIQTLYVWKYLSPASTHYLGQTSGVGQNCFYYNGSDAVIYYVYQNSTTDPWHLTISAYDLNESEWFFYDTSITTLSDTHYAPAIAATPDGYLIILMGYFSPLNYSLSTFSANEADTASLISNWEPFQTIAGTSTWSYSFPCWFSDKLVVFGREGSSMSANLLFINSTVDAGWGSEVTLATHPTDMASIYWQFTYGQVNGSYILVGGFGYDGWEFRNMYAMWSPDEGNTWRRINETSSQALPIDATILQVATTPDTSDAKCAYPILDENNHPLIAYNQYNKNDVYSAVVMSKYSYQGVCQFSATLGNTGTWTSYNVTDAQSGSQIMVAADGCAMLVDKWWNRPAFWAAPNGSEIYYVRVQGNSSKFLAVVSTSSHNYVYLNGRPVEPTVLLPSSFYEFLLFEKYMCLGNVTTGSYNVTSYNSALWGSYYTATENVTADIGTIYNWMNYTYSDVTFQMAIYYASNMSRLGYSTNSVAMTSGSYGMTGWCLPTSFLANQSVTLVANTTYYVCFKHNLDGIVLKYTNSSSVNQTIYQYSPWDNDESTNFPATLNNISARYNWTLAIAVCPSQFRFVGVGVMQFDSSQTKASANKAGASCTFSAEVFDDNGLSMANFRSNNTGSWDNSTYTSLSDTSSMIYFTLTLTSTTVQCYVLWEIWVNDTNNIWGHISTQYLSVYPTYFYVNNNASNVDGYANVGISSNFTAERYYDGISDTLTEANMSATSGTSFFGNPGAAPSTYVTFSANYMYGEPFTSPANAALVYNMSFLGRITSGSLNVKAVLCNSSLYIVSNAISNPVTVTSTTPPQWWNATFSTPPTITGNTQYILMLISSSANFRLYYSATTGYTAYRDTTNSYTTPSNPTDAGTQAYHYRIYCNCSITTASNYQLNIEEQWIGIDYPPTNTNLCISTGTFNTSEILQVQGYNTANSSWTVIGNITTQGGWNNFTVSPWLSATSKNNFTIKFIDTNQSLSDTECSSWQKESALLYTWSAGATVTWLPNQTITSVLSGSRIGSFPRASSVNLLAAFSAARTDSLLRSPSLFVFVQSIVNRVFSSSKSASLSLLFSPSVAQSYGATRSVTLATVIQATASRLFSGTRPASQSLSLVMSTTRLYASARSTDLASLMSTVASRLVSLPRVGSADFLLSPSGSRVASNVRSPLLSLSILFATSRVLSEPRLSSFDMSVSVLASRVLSNSRNPLLSMSLLFSGSRSLTMPRSALLNVLARASASRLFSGSRSTTTALSLSAITSRASSATRTSTLQTVLQAIGGRVFAGTRSSILALPMLAIASRTYTGSRQSVLSMFISAIGVKGSVQSRFPLLSIITVSSANRVASLGRSSTLNILTILSQYRTLSLSRDASLSLPMTLLPSVTTVSSHNLNRFAIVTIGAIANAMRSLTMHRAATSTFMLAPHVDIFKPSITVFPSGALITSQYIFRIAAFNVGSDLIGNKLTAHETVTVDSVNGWHGTLTVYWVLSSNSSSNKEIFDAQQQTLSIADQQAQLDQTLSTVYFWNALTNDKMTVTTYIMSSGVKSPEAMVQFQPSPAMSIIRPYLIFIAVLIALIAAFYILFVAD